MFLNYFKEHAVMIKFAAMNLVACWLSGKVKSLFTYGGSHLPTMKVLSTA